MTAFANIDDKISFCFENPTLSPSAHKRGTLASVLYLLRRELIETAGYDPAGGDDEHKVDAGGVHRRLFASLILMFTAFDLLAKFHLGDQQGIGKRFKDFLQSSDAAQMDNANTELFWAIRNSLVHAFSVPDVTSLQKLGMKTVSLERRKEFDPTGKVKGLYTVSRRGDVAVIYIDGVFRTLHWTIDHYRDTLHGTGSGAARSLFESMFDKYGTINWA